MVSAPIQCSAATRIEPGPHRRVTEVVGVGGCIATAPGPSRCPCWRGCCETPPSERRRPSRRRTPTTHTAIPTERQGRPGRCGCTSRPAAAARMNHATTACSTNTIPERAQRSPRAVAQHRVVPGILALADAADARCIRTAARPTHRRAPVRGSAATQPRRGRPDQTTDATAHGDERRAPHDVHDVCSGRSRPRRPTSRRTIRERRRTSSARPVRNGWTAKELTPAEYHRSEIRRS